VLQGHIRATQSSHLKDAFGAADKLANNYNAFASAESERTGRLLGYEAKVESCKDGSFYLYFPVIKSAEMRRAMRAADCLFTPKKRKTARPGRLAAA